MLNVQQLTIFFNTIAVCFRHYTSEVVLQISEVFALLIPIMKRYAAEEFVWKLGIVVVILL